MEADGIDEMIKCVVNTNRTSLTNTDKDQSNENLFLDKILCHLYKGKTARFRASSSNYKIIVILSIEELLKKYKHLARTYLKDLNTHAVKTLFQRHPAILELLEKNDNEQRTWRPRR